jgi:hypothetical protein
MHYDYLVIGVICLFVGIFVGLIVQYLIGEPKCDHTWEKIIDDKSAAGAGHVVVYMCKKCGKRKYAKTKI